jgi:HSP20 family protein
LGSNKGNESQNIKYVKRIVTEVMGEEFWNGLHDVVTSERPKVDIYDDGNRLVLLFELPGILNTEDMSISVTTNKINIKGIRKDKFNENKPGKKIKSECIYETCNRTIELPYVVDDKNIKAVYENGVLEITMERINSVYDRTINVEFRK